ncbi:MAG: hypothetical protein GWO24_04310, partial [Akkermansiaceae bacterium]|nr:hypothetical protein [Akkermansiaceae bacterium]
MALAGSALVAVLGAARAQQPLSTVRTIGHTEGGKVTFTVNSHPDHYHVLRRSRDLTSDRGRAVAVVAGEDGVAT